MTRIAIIGLGLIGGSLALALKARGHEDIEITGSDLDGRTLRQAKAQGAIDQAEPDAARAVQGAGLVILAVPPVQLLALFETIAPHLARGAAVSDVASTKRLVMQWAQGALPPTVSFVGGHPMAGKTEGGFANADARLFQGRPYAVVPALGAGEPAVRSVLGLIHTIGAQERFMAADEHDDLVAAVSHLPLLASTALFTLLRGSPGWPDFAKIAGPAYRDLTRLASGSPQMATDIAVTNSARMQYWLDRYILELQRLRHLLDEDADHIFTEFQQAQAHRARFLAGEDLDDAPPGEPLPSASAQIGAMLLSPKLYERLRAALRGPHRDAAPPARR